MKSNKVSLFCCANKYTFAFVCVNLCESVANKFVLKNTVPGQIEFLKRVCDTSGFEFHNLSSIYSAKSRGFLIKTLQKVLIFRERRCKKYSGAVL